MTEVEIADLLRGAQAALEENRPQEAIAACQHARQHFPDAITALRLLGEAYLEVGRPEDASGAFEAVLRNDPFNVLARIGLAVIAEERGDDERALVQFRLAWEVDPLLPQLRAELVRLYRKRYGPGGHLRMTRPALAMLHMRNLDLVRAIKEYRTLVQEYPARHELALGLADALWRRGDDGQARILCERLLVTTPRLARVLYMLADIIATQGGDPSAYLATVRELDPNADIARALHAARPSALLAAYMAEPIRVRAFDPAAVPVGDAPREPATTSLGTSGPLTWEALAASWSDELAPGGGEQPRGTTAGDREATLFADLGRERTGEGVPRHDEVTAVQPFTWSPEPHPSHEQQAVTDQGPLEAQAGAMAPQPGEPDAITRLTTDWDHIDAELAAAMPEQQAAPTDSAFPPDAGMADTAPFALDQFQAPAPPLPPGGADAAAAVPTGGSESGDHQPDPAVLPGLEARDSEGTLTPFRLDAVTGNASSTTLSFSELLQQSATAAAAVAGDTPRSAAAEDDSRGDVPVSRIETSAADGGATGADAPMPRAETSDVDGASMGAEDAPVPDVALEQPAGPAAQMSAAGAVVGTRDLGAREERAPEAAPEASAQAPEAAPEASEQAPLETSDAFEQAAQEPRTGQPPSQAGTSVPAAADSADEQTGYEALYGSLPSAYSDATDEIPVLPATDDLPTWLRSDLFAVTAPNEVDATTQAGALSGLHDGPYEEAGPTTPGEADGPDQARPAPDAGPHGLIAATQGSADAAINELAPPTSEPAAIKAALEPGPEGPLVGVVPMSAWRADWQAPALAPEPPTPEDGTAREAAQASTTDALAGTGPALVEHEVSAGQTSGWEVPGALADSGTTDMVAPSGPSGPVHVADTWDSGGQLTQDAGDHQFSDQEEQAPAVGHTDEAPHEDVATQEPAFSSPEEELAAYRQRVKESDTVPLDVVTALRRMIAAGAGGPRAHRVLGEAYLKLGEYDLASAELQQALRARFPR